MNKIVTAAVATLAIAGGAYYLTRPADGPAPVANGDTPAQGDPIVAVTMPDPLPADAQMGQRAFQATCAACHGADAGGRMGLGPPLVHKIYEPSHHGDMSFQIAVERGVRAHHWPFGDMPPQKGLTRADVETIVAYVRTLQQANGIN